MQTMASVTQPTMDSPLSSGCVAWSVCRYATYAGDQFAFRIAMLDVANVLLMDVGDHWRSYQRAFRIILENSSGASGDLWHGIKQYRKAAVLTPNGDSTRLIMGPDAVWALMSACFWLLRASEIATILWSVDKSGAFKALVRLRCSMTRWHTGNSREDLCANIMTPLRLIYG